MGSVHPADPDRGRRRHRLRGSDQGRLDVRADRRGDRHRQAHRHRLALLAAHREPQAGAGRSRARTARSSSCTAAATRAIRCRSNRSFPSSGRQGARGRRHRAHLGQQRQDPDITGGLPRVAECSRRAGQGRDHRGNQGNGAVRHATSRTSAPDHRAERGGRRAGRVSDSEVEAHPTAGRRRHREGRVHRRRQSGAARHPRHQGRRGWRRISSTRSRRSIGCKASASTTAHRSDVRQMLQKVDIVEPATPTSSPASRSTRPNSKRPTRSCAPKARRKPSARRCCSASPRRACRPARSSPPRRSRRRPRLTRGGQRQGGHARGPQGERQRRPSDPGRQRRRDDQAALHRDDRDTLIMAGKVEESAAALAVPPVAAPTVAPAPSARRRKSRRPSDHRDARPEAGARLKIVRGRAAFGRRFSRRRRARPGRSRHRRARAPIRSSMGREVPLCCVR